MFNKYTKQAVENIKKYRSAPVYNDDVNIDDIDLVVANIEKHAKQYFVKKDIYNRNTRKINLTGLFIAFLCRPARYYTRLFPCNRQSILRHVFCNCTARSNIGSFANFNWRYKTYNHWQT